jgi:sorbitol-specific phosphotransferase system component IIA
MHPPHMHVLLSQFLQRPTRLQHIAFLFSIEMIGKRRKQKIKELHHRTIKNMRQ